MRYIILNLINQTMFFSILLATLSSKNVLNAQLSVPLLGVEAISFREAIKQQHSAC